MPLNGFNVVVLQLSLHVKALDFVDDPFEIDLGPIYLPPDEDFFLLCSTDEPSNITLVAASGTVYGPGQASLNITQVTDRLSTLFVKSDNFMAKGILVVEAKFVCRAYNSVYGTENITREFEFELGGKPALRDHSGNVEVPEKEGAELKCSIPTYVVPRPSVAWTFENGSRDSALETTRIETSLLEDTYVLKVKGLLIEDGVYRCNATNRFGFALSKPIRLTVTYFLENEFQFVIKPMRAQEGSQVTFSVTVRAYPPPSSIAITRKEVVFTLMTGSNAFIYSQEAKRSMMGEYCAVAVHQSRNYTKMKNLTVLSTLRDSNFAVTEVSRSSFNYMWHVDFDCYPPVTKVTICCTNDSDVIRSAQCSEGNSKTTPVTSGVRSDTLDGLIPKSVYYCQVFAANDISSSGSQTISVKVPNVPNMPTVACVNINETYVTVEWAVSSDGGDRILDYNICYSSETSHRCFLHQLVVPSERSFTLTGLKRKTQYVIEVTARNSIGSSSPARTLCNTTCIVAVNFLNSDVLEVDEEDDALLKFNIFSDDCGNVMKYDVKRCGEKWSLDLFNFHSNAEVWMCVKGLHSGRDCVTVTVTTNEGFVSFKDFSVDVKKEVIQKLNPVYYYMCSIVGALCCCGCRIYTNYQKKK